MRIFSPRRRRTLRNALLAAAAVGLPALASAKDLPPSAEGVQKLNAVFATYLGKSAEGAASVVAIAVDGDHYAVSVDVARLAAPLKETGFWLDPLVLKYNLTPRDDGSWRVTEDGFPSISIHIKDFVETVDTAGYRLDGVFDPALGLFRTAESSFDRQEVKAHSPKVEEAIAVGGMKTAQLSGPAANGGASGNGRIEFADLSAALSVTPHGSESAAADPVAFSSKAGKLSLGGSYEGFKIRGYFDLWAFLVAHPSRAEIAANEAAFKTLLRALIPRDTKGDEAIGLENIDVTTSRGSFGLTSARLTLAQDGWSPKSKTQYRLTLDHPTLPAGLAPANLQGFVPTLLDIGVRVGGYDIAGAAEEAIDDMHLAGDGSILSPLDEAKIGARFKGSAPLIVDILPSRVLAPQADLAVEGQIHVEGAHPFGALTVHARNFDQTVAALKDNLPFASPQMIGGLALRRASPRRKAMGRSPGSPNMARTDR